MDALVMDSEKHQKLLLAVEKAIEHIMMSRPRMTTRKAVSEAVTVIGSWYYLLSLSSGCPV